MFLSARDLNHRAYIATINNRYRGIDIKIATFIALSGRSRAIASSSWHRFLQSERARGRGYENNNNNNCVIASRRKRRAASLSSRMQRL